MLESRCRSFMRNPPNGSPDHRRTPIWLLPLPLKSRYIPKLAIGLSDRTESMLDGVSLDQLRAFIAAADEGSFSAAARKLRRAQAGGTPTMANLGGQPRVE